MKNLKLTAAALALIAAAVFTNSAKAQVLSDGDILFGVYDTAATGAAPNSFEVDLGAFNTLTVGETFMIGSNLASAFSTDATPVLKFNIVGTGNVGGGGLDSSEIAFSTSQVVTTVSNSNTNSATNNIENLYDPSGTVVATGTSSNTTTFTEFTDPNSDHSSIGYGATHPNNYGIGVSSSVLTPYTLGSTAVANFYTEENHANPILTGVWELSGSGASTELTFLGTATPEPSTYVLMLGGLVGLVAFLRRRENA
jgi:hypothetical protein